MRKQQLKTNDLTVRMLFLSIILAFYSCEKEVDFKLKPGGEKVVVEGSIEIGQPPFILLTKSLNFFQKIDINEDIFLHDAHITVSDGQETITLREYRIDNPSIPFFFYSIDSSDLNSRNFKGEFGKTYRLEINYANNIYESVTSIPFPKGLDSLWAIPPPEAEMPKEYPNAMLLYARYTDPDTFGNRVRYFTKRNRENFQTSFFSTYDDAIVNSTTVDIVIPRGFNRADSFDMSTYGYFYKGDTVVVKWSAIDKNVFDFWRTLEFSAGSTGNPFAAPVEVSTNISGGALGVWAGYGSTYDTLIIPQ